MKLKLIAVNTLVLAVAANATIASAADKYWKTWVGGEEWYFAAWSNVADLSGDTTSPAADDNVYIRSYSYNARGNQFHYRGPTTAVAPFNLLAIDAQSPAYLEFVQHGNLAARNEIIGTAKYGAYYQQSGSNTVDETLTVGAAVASGQGVYRLENGTVSARNMVVGASSSGIFYQGNEYWPYAPDAITPAVAVSETLTLAQQKGAALPSRYWIVAGALSARNISLGDAGTGIFNHNGGSNTVAEKLWIGRQAGSEGTYNLRAGNLNVNGDIVNGAGQGSLLITGGALNFGAGNHDVDVDTLNVTGEGSIKLANGAVATFQKDVLHNGKAIDLASGTNAIFNGAFTGKGPFTGAGTATFNSVLNIGDGIGLLNAAGNVKLGDGSKSVFEVAGTTRASGYDAFDIGGALQVDGELKLVSLNGFEAGLGDVFDLLSAETITGRFDLLTLLLLDDGLAWKIDYLVDAVGTKDIVRLSVVNSVPLPASVWLLQSALFGLLAMRRYSRKNR